ncbi:hypothetical protein EON65_20735 [archaeon]|nr:MAG: hypothetical protein EON65_20735 [archaeon]
MDESEAKLGTDSSLIDEETLGEDDLEGVDDELEETEEVEVISVFRLKLLKAQLHSDASNIVMQVDQGLEEFTSQVEKVGVVCARLLCLTNQLLHVYRTSKTTRPPSMRWMMRLTKLTNGD